MVPLGAVASTLAARVLVSNRSSDLPSADVAYLREVAREASRHRVQLARGRTYRIAGLLSSAATANRPCPSGLHAEDAEAFHENLKLPDCERGGMRGGGVGGTHAQAQLTVVGF
jgi:hypothetical protein